LKRPTAIIDNTEIPDSDDASQNGPMSRDVSDISPHISLVKTENLLSFATPRASTSASRREIGQDNRNVTEEADHQFSEATATLMRQQTVIDELSAINFMLKNQLAASEKRFEDHLTIWNNTTKQKTDERALFDCRRQLRKAAEETTRLKAILKFRTTEGLNMESTGLKIPDIQKELDYITTRSKMTFDFNKTLTFEIPDHIPPNSETECLLRMVISGEGTSNSDMLLNLTATKDVKPLNLVRAMMSSALHHWIFESDWPKFHHRPCIKLHGYREYISLQEGTSESP
jgi:hypothetical protein